MARGRGEGERVPNGLHMALLTALQANNHEALGFPRGIPSPDGVCGLTNWRSKGQAIQVLTRAIEQFFAKVDKPGRTEVSSAGGL